jgi:hypothetical protein
VSWKFWTRRETRRRRETRGRVIPRPQKPAYTRRGDKRKNRTAAQSRRQGAQTKANALSREDLAQRVINSRSVLSRIKLLIAGSIEQLHILPIEDLFWLVRAAQKTKDLALQQDLV